MRAGYDAVTRGDVEGMAPRGRVASDPPGEPLMLQMGNPYRNPSLRWDEVGYLERLVSVGKQCVRRHSPRVARLFVWGDDSVSNCSSCSRAKGPATSAGTLPTAQSRDPQRGANQ